MESLLINGAFGEGGGQIVRTAITLSCITSQSIIVENVRKNRKSPGLKPQHITAIKILQEICNADVEGAEIGSTTFKFTPKKIRSTTLCENVGTAGSIPLILQVVIPVSAICQINLDLTIQGGTDGKWSPTMDYTQHVLREAYSRTGIHFTMDIIKRGYYPRGGGIVKVRVIPSKKIIPLSLKKRNTNKVKLFCSYSKLSDDIISSNITKVEKKLLENNFNIKTKVLKENAIDSGASILLCSIDSQSIIGIDSLFETSSNNFNENIIQRFIQNNLGVDENLADMIVVPASIAKGMTIIHVKNISKHLETNLYVASKMTGCRYGIGKTKEGFELRIEGVSDPSIQ